MQRIDSLSWSELESPFGSLLAAASECGLAILMRTDSRYMPQGERGKHCPGLPLFTELSRQLEAYAAGERREFSVPLDPHGTEFQLRVWQALLRIPWGSTTSYLQLARELGNEGAVRAVGHANGRNPIHILIPCHRVIGGDGSLRGYAGGIGMKQQLLEIEGHAAQARQAGLFG